MLFLDIVSKPCEMKCAVFRLSNSAATVLLRETISVRCKNESKLHLYTSLYASQVKRNNGKFDEK